MNPHTSYPTPQQLREALARYYDGRTSVAEEQALAAYFAEADDVPAEFAADRDVFLALADARREARLEAMIGALAEAEAAPVVPLRPRRRWWAVAASAAVLLGLGATAWHTLRPAEPEAFADTCTTPAEAEAELCRALAMITSRTGAGIDKIEAAGRRANRPSRAAEKYISFE